MVKYLTKEEVVAGHYFMMKQMRDMEQAGVKDHSLLESAVHRLQQSVFGEDAHPTLFEKAAALVDSLAKNHCFHNGNKRTAYLSVKSFLKINGYHLKMEREFAANFMVDIVNGKYSIAEMAQIFAENCIKM
ncbi:type II toxin-antitoxin system death-on-curing family toxin [Paenibacillus thiaminolyticus]|uniref:type II toxin-antitoxin system death-on-curing family toxin n=1 Tax=Paenibacillus thiaminolyticus TaxID=49283 RepID=UPI0011637AF0|nr:type II toxin-antitoxin system death-on-curing family toxin [Paenibacillus thiaminolyticus]NGP60805.1 type II toxin-antitoxin system death-on-curing family toxin [Paenibacillus thiaminolyticus]